MAENNNNTSPSNTTQTTAAPQPGNTSIWQTVNTSTTANVERLEIRKSDDYDRIVKKSQ